MNNTEGRLNGIGVATLIIFLAVTFVIAFFLHLISTSGDLAPFHTDLIMLVTTCMILAILYWLFFRKRKKHKRIKEVIEEIPFKLETRTAIEMEEMKTTGDLSVEQVIDWREPEHGLQQGEDKCLEDLAHLRRIDTVEEMASIIAHELNQPLCAILNYSNVCVRFMKCSDNVQNKMADAIEEINIQAKRARQIIKGLRRLVVDHEPRLPTVHVNNDIVHEVVSIMQTEARQKNINIQTKLAHNIPVICIDNIQIIQVLLNLVRNAFDAMDNTDIDSRRLIIQTVLTEDNTIEISVRDTGKGLPDDVSARIFDTFFTTKTDGLGIGLPLCRRIIEALGGIIWLENNPDCGMTSKFTLPLDEDRQYGELQANNICCR